MPPHARSTDSPPANAAGAYFPYPQKVDAIDASTDAGRERLKKVVATLLNSYLAQLLESGFLHADPHPGNFLCTPDGKLCVLDMGLMTEARMETVTRYDTIWYTIRSDMVFDPIRSDYIRHDPIRYFAIS